MRVLITGTSGFIGFHVAKRFLSLGHEVVGVDNNNDYYDVNLKEDRLNILNKNEKFTFHKIDISNHIELKIIREYEFDIIVHLAAQAGVRYSIENPDVYVKSNLVGHANVLELCRASKSKKIIYASSSSVYGDSSKVPFSTSDIVDEPVSFYAATKKANEAMSYSYSNLYDIKAIGLRFFTVYGPYGRPDMAPMKFAESIWNGKSIDVYNNGDMSRDFTHIDDIVEAILRLAMIEDNYVFDLSRSVKHRLFNIGAGSPTNLMDFINILEKEIGKKAIKNMLPMQNGDVKQTWADTSELFDLIKFKPSTELDEGIKNFVDWFKSYKGIS